MTKQEFIGIMTELLSIKTAEENLNKAIKKFEPDLSYLCFGRYETLVVRSLEFAMNDKDKWISWWIYDHKCGKSKLNVRKKDGTIIPSKTPANLYDLITNK